MNFYYCLDLSRAGTRTHEKVSNWLKTGHENHQTRSTGTRWRAPVLPYSNQPFLILMMPLSYTLYVYPVIFDFISLSLQIYFVYIGIIRFHHPLFLLQEVLFLFLDLEPSLNCTQILNIFFHHCCNCCVFLALGVLWVLIEVIFSF